MQRHFVYRMSHDLIENTNCAIVTCLVSHVKMRALLSGLDFFSIDYTEVISE